MWKKKKKANFCECRFLFRGGSAAGNGARRHLQTVKRNAPRLFFCPPPLPARTTDTYIIHVPHTSHVYICTYVRSRACVCVCKCLRKGRTPLKARAPSKVNFITRNLRPFFLLYFPSKTPPGHIDTLHTCRQPAISTVYTAPLLATPRLNRLLPSAVVTSV